MKNIKVKRESNTINFKITILKGDHNLSQNSRGSHINLLSSDGTKHAMFNNIDEIPSKIRKLLKVAGYKLQVKSSKKTSKLIHFEYIKSK